METETMFLCRPCAEKMRGFKTVKSVELLQHKRGKDICGQCLRRRYGYMCRVEFREAEND